MISAIVSNSLPLVVELGTRPSYRATCYPIVLKNSIFALVIRLSR